MLFTPHTKRKKGVSHKWRITPFPTCSVEKRFQGIFTGISVEVSDPQDIRSIYESGCYGKGSESRSVPKVLAQSDSRSAGLQHTSTDESLTLSLEEACFLAYFLQVLQIKDLQGSELTSKQLLQAAERINSHYVEHLAAYLYLKSKGWVVKSGIKFGGHFLIYKNGPRFYHASFVVFICAAGDETLFAAKNLKGLQRIAETSDKDVLLLELTKPNNFLLNTLTDLAAIGVTETIVRRFNCTAFVQNQNSTK